MNHKIFLAISVLLALFVFTPLPQAGADDFYKGKTIKIVVGFLAGDVYDLWARLYAQYMPKHIPGKPDHPAGNFNPYAGQRALYFGF